jgi:hypothetical protein
MMETVLITAAGTVIGALVGWVGTALTLVGEVKAIKGAVERIELRMDQLQGVKR